MTPIFLKSLATAILLIPIAFLMLFTVGELASGDLSGASHLLQLLPILILVVLGWKYPRVVGLILVAAAVVLGVLYALDNSMRVATIIIVEAILFVPLAIAGLLFFKGVTPKTPNTEPEKD